MDINKYLNCPNKICYELWGNDTFSNGTYLCGLYTTDSAANRARRKHEADCKETQSEGLRDYFWITPTTVAEHIAMLEERDRYRRETWDKIDSHKVIIDEVWPQFRRLAYSKSGEAGVHSIYFLTSYPDCEFVQLNITNRKEYERKRMGPDVYHMTVGIEFKDNWTAARFKAASAQMRSGKLEALKKYGHEEIFFERAHEFLFKTIEKYFYGN